MPTAASPPEAARRDAEPPDEPTRTAPRVRQAARATTGASLLWLWALLGSSALGLVTGGTGFYFVRTQHRPAENDPVVEKPPVDAQPPTDPTKVNPPKVDPPKTDPPKSDPPKSDPPKVDPPKPKDAGSAPVAASTIPGLKFYLACDRLDGGKVIESVSGKQVGTAFGVELTDGPRGKALRLTHDRKYANRHALELADAREQLAVPADQSFTLAFWARRVHSDTNSGFGAEILDAGTDANARHTRALRLQLLPSTPSLAAVTLTEMSNRFDPGTLKGVYPMNKVAAPTEWTHFALVRDAGKVRWLVNGAEAPDARPAPFPGELRFDTIGLLRSTDGKTVIDLDEFCLFDRVLTADELAQLTGLKIAPRPKDPVIVEAKLPPGAVPAPTDFKGLRFYLPCQQITNGSLLEAVSGKNVGRGQKLEPVDGPRGKAVRATAGGPGGAKEAFDLTTSAEALAIEEGKPFTLALWVRTDDWGNLGAQFVSAQLNTPELFRSLTIYRYTKGVGFLLQQGKPGGRPDPINQLARGTRELPPAQKWIHLALSRDEKGTVRLAVDGEVVVTAAGLFTAEVRFTSFALVSQLGGSFTADFDEFCLFDRILTADELTALAGRKAKDGIAIGPKDPPVGPKDPPIVAPKGPPVELAPPPRVAVAAEPLEIAPFPAEVGPKVPPAPEVIASAPAGVDPKGLLLYLPFDEVKDGRVREGVSGKFAGKCEGVELVNGPRGKAARLAADRADGPGANRLDFGDLADRTNVVAGKPFTLALWMRAEPREPGAKASGTIVQFGVRPDREYDRALQIGFGAAGTLHATARSTPDRLDPKRETAARWTGLANPAKWQHLAMVRDEKNIVRWYLNGKVVPQPGKPDPVWDGPLSFDRILIGDPEQTKVILEVDELCLFERAVSAEELKKLSEPAK
jgi:hypothetical protein